ncbi:sulfotransferase domain-containing protein (plasmid) [Methanohalobium evestigatum Z-7303]|uniref:Sulfotransferase domain-containing protein n=1 Tax=Methanohalobium evestigatum (strain ATCC BAA-1072 / DSM 3721 / NBRC 107634 / OCM 161 / Z-7303) TaxID=644295 RepID=D7EBY6_METEZ|nr:sulfotransferase [Methanohalobium evestigatum]ADI75108.1 sulfotransferase domain-containing protein [Methanohalobium evestigatum Z-7303]
MDYKTSNSQKIKVIYILGSGRSGSTLIDIVLGNHPEIESKGELYDIIKKYENNELCSCDTPSQICPFWIDVINRWKEQTKIDDLAFYENLQKKVESLKGLSLLLKNKNNSNINDYIFYTQALYHSISTVSGKNIIVDSSKKPSRALAISMMPNVDLCLIHLVRDGRGVTYSGMKEGKKSLRFPLGWMYNNLLSEIVFYTIGSNKAQIRYEDFVNYPVKTLKLIGEVAGINLSQVSEKLVNKKEIKINHLLAGNRIRNYKTIKLQPDYKWKEKLSYKNQLPFLIFAWPLGIKYGYIGRKTTKK